MKFKVTTAGYFYDDSEKEKLEQLGFSEWGRYEGRWSRKGYAEIEIDTLEDLLKFQEKWGTLVLVDYKDEGPEIEIYDDYRE